MYDIVAEVGKFASLGDNIAVSACLMGCNCRYDGRGFDRPAITKLAEHYNLIPICPESGLGTPRESSERRGSAVLSKSGTDVTEQFVQGASEALAVCMDAKVRVAVLKSRSPSCGVGTIYDGSFTGTLVSGNGVAASMLMEAGIVCIPMD